MTVLKPDGRLDPEKQSRSEFGRYAEFSITVNLLQPQRATDCIRAVWHECPLSVITLGSAFTVRNRSMAQTRIRLVVFFSTAYLLCTVQAQYEKYSFKSFPANELMPLESAYGHALELYEAQDWTQSAKYLELSLRLHRLLKDSEAHCGQNCSSVGREQEENNTETTLFIMGHIITRAACLKRCKTNFPVFSKSHPKRETVGDFEQRIPYRYLQNVYYQVSVWDSFVRDQNAFTEAMRRSTEHGNTRWMDINGNNIAYQLV